MVFSQADSKKAVRAYVDIWNEQKYSEIPTRISKDFVMYDPGATARELPGPKREVHGRDGLRRFIEIVTTGFPDIEIAIFDMVTKDGVVMYKGKISATHDGPYDGLPPTGRSVEIPLMSECSLKDGRIDEHRVYFNQMEVLEQLGLMFPEVLQQAPKLTLKRLQSIL